MTSRFHVRRRPDGIGLALSTVVPLAMTFSIGLAALLAAPPAPAAGSETRVAAGATSEPRLGNVALGEVVALDLSQKRLSLRESPRPKEGKPIIVYWTATTRFQLAGKAAGAKELAVGDTLKVTFQAGTDKNVATAIVIIKATPNTPPEAETE